MSKRRQVHLGTEAERGRVLLMLFDKILAEIHLAQVEPPRFVGSVMKAQLGVAELDRTLNWKPMPQLAYSLHNLYLHVLLLMSEALKTRDLSPLGQAYRFLCELRSAFASAQAIEAEAKAG